MKGCRSASLGLLFVVLAGASVWVMLCVSGRSGNDAIGARLIRPTALAVKVDA